MKFTRIRVNIFIYMAANQKEFYKRIKIAGMLSFIPVVLAGGIFLGLISGDFLQEKFPQVRFALPICIGIGLAASIIEAVRIIKLALKTDQEE